MLDNKRYYDVFSSSYEDQRHHGYHRFLDEAEFDLVCDLAAGREVLEIGCGTGLILERLASVASRAAGIDLSPGMLELARQRGLDVYEANATELPFDDASFDLAVSFKVLAHVEAIGDAMAEMARVVRPGGRIVAEFYNRDSVRALVKRLKPKSPIGADGTARDTDVYTRYDRLAELKALLPPTLRLDRVDGIRIASPAALPFNLPVVGPLWTAFERALSRTPLRYAGGFLVLTLERTS